VHEGLTVAEVLLKEQRRRKQAAAGAAPSAGELCYSRLAVPPVAEVPGSVRSMLGPRSKMAFKQTIDKDRK
jgi:hypothetical protein